MHSNIFSRFDSCIRTQLILALSVIFAAGTVGQLSAQDFGNPFGAADNEPDEKVSFTAEFKIIEDSNRGEISVTANIIPEWYVYSVTQEKPALATVIRLDESDDYRVAGDWKPLEKPEIKFDKTMKIDLEKHHDQVTWTANLILSDKVDPEDLKIGVSISGQTCKVSCILLNEKTNATLAGYLPAAVTEYREENAHVKWSGFAIPSAAKPGDKVTLWLEGTPDPGWHLYEYSAIPSDGNDSPTLIHVENDLGFTVGTAKPESPAVEEDVFGKKMMVHHDATRWSVELTLPADLKSGDYELSGLVGYQVCDETCDRPSGIKFFVPLKVASEADEKSVAVSFVASDYDDVADAITSAAKSDEAVNRTVEKVKFPAPTQVDSPEQVAAMAKLYDPSKKIVYVKLDGSTGRGTLWAAVVGAFLGGMILNLMPCVFPVLGLKVLGFVEQAGSDPRKIKLHGIAFAFGLVFSMWVLAGIIVGFKYFSGQEVTWGQQMGDPYFVGAIVILLFVLGLNLAGVFEMGLFMTRVGGADKKKGYSGSFFSGIITTLVATPCSGPFLGAAMGYTLAQPPAIAMILFTIFGLGIAFPYLVLAFMPKLIGLLPKPGAWMETFKKLMAFTLFAAAAFFVKSFGKQTGVDGLGWFLLAMCVIALAAFFYGKWSPAYVKKNRRYVWGWGMPFIIAGLGIWMYLDAARLKAPEVASADHGWQLWVPGKVESLLADKKPIWVDYTADW